MTEIRAPGRICGHTISDFADEPCTLSVDLCVLQPLKRLSYQPVDALWKYDVKFLQTKVPPLVDHFVQFL